MDLLLWTQRFRSKGIDVVQDRGLPQHDLPDHVADLDAVGINRSEAGAAGW
jgi:hypothetical protein